jgi:hypothetical protein
LDVATSFLLRAIYRATGKGTGTGAGQPGTPASRKPEDEQEGASTLPRLFCLHSPKPKRAPTLGEQALSQELAEATRPRWETRTLVLLAVAGALAVYLLFFS